MTNAKEESRNEGAALSGKGRGRRVRASEGLRGGVTGGADRCVRILVGNVRSPSRLTGLQVEQNEGHLPNSEKGG